MGLDLLHLSKNIEYNNWFEVNNLFWLFHKYMKVIQNGSKYPYWITSRALVMIERKYPKVNDFIGCEGRDLIFDMTCRMNMDKLGYF